MHFKTIILLNSKLYYLYHFKNIFIYFSSYWYRNKQIYQEYITISNEINYLSFNLFYLHIVLKKTLLVEFKLHPDIILLL